MVNLESLGVPGVFVASREHPIQDRTDAEMVSIAEAAFDELVSQLVGEAS
jgi:hypothetical protein